MIYAPNAQIVPVILTEAYMVGLEHHCDPGDGRWRLFTHCHVFAPWTASLYKALRRDFAALHSRIDAPLHALHDITDDVHRKFLRAGGFAPTEQVWFDIENRPRQLFVRARESITPDGITNR